MYNKFLVLITVFLTNNFFFNYAFAKIVPPTIDYPPKDTTFFDVITNVGNLLLFISGSIVVVMVVIGGIRYIASAGNPTMIEGAKKTITSALIALAIIILSTGILNTINWILNYNGAINPASVTGGNSGGSEGGEGSGGTTSEGGNVQISSLPQVLQDLINNNTCSDGVAKCDYNSGQGYFCMNGGQQNDVFYDEKGKPICKDDKTAKDLGSCQTYGVKSCNMIYNPEITCRQNTDCGCGVKKNSSSDTDCLVGNTNYLEPSKPCQTPDFCSGVSGDMVPRCVNSSCKLVTPSQSSSGSGGSGGTSSPSSGSGDGIKSGSSSGSTSNSPGNRY